MLQLKPGETYTLEATGGVYKVIQDGVNLALSDVNKEFESDDQRIITGLFPSTDGFLYEGVKAYNLKTKTSKWYSPATQTIYRTVDLIRCNVETKTINFLEIGY